MGVSDTMAQTSIRFGLGRETTEAEIEQVIGRVAEAVKRLRDISPLSHAVRPQTAVPPARV
jgi:cysteine desulfurase